MQDRKLLIPVRCTTRKIYLQPPPAGRNDWHVRFTAPSIDGADARFSVAQVPRRLLRRNESRRKSLNRSGPTQAAAPNRSNSGTITQPLANYSSDTNEMPYSVPAIRVQRAIAAFDGKNGAHRESRRKNLRACLTAGLIREFKNADFNKRRTRH